MYWITTFKSFKTPYKFIKKKAYMVELFLHNLICEDNER